MGMLEIVLLGIALSMDAVAVSLSNGLVYKKITSAKLLAMPLLFGFFQGAMPFIGYFAGGFFADFLDKYAGIISLVILGFIGIKMVVDGAKCETDDDNCAVSSLTYRVLLVQAVATSIDAFAVGIGLSALGVEILPAVLIIALTTFLCCSAAVGLGKRFGHLLGNKAQIFGGIILIVIGIKALF